MNHLFLVVGQAGCCNGSLVSWTAGAHRDRASAQDHAHLASLHVASLGMRPCYDDFPSGSEYAEATLQWKQRLARSPHDHGVASHVDAHVDYVIQEVFTPCDPTIAPIIVSDGWDFVFGERDSVRIHQDVESLDDAGEGEVNKCDVAEILALREGNVDHESWLGVFRLKDGRFLCVEAGCSYTGFDGGGEHCELVVANNLGTLILRGLSNEGRHHFRDLVVKTFLPSGLGADAPLCVIADWYEEAGEGPVAAMLREMEKYQSRRWE